jgi:ABC-2 type transport system permease protein
MRSWIAFWSILLKDIKAYYLKPPNISWGLVFPVAWTLAFFLRSDAPVSILDLLPGVMALAVLFGTTSMLAVTITFERKNREFDRLLLAPLTLNQLMLAKTTGAIAFGMVNAVVPLVLAGFMADLHGINWLMILGSVLLIAATSTFLGLLIAVSVKEVFEAQTFSNFFRFPMIFLCGLFVPVSELPVLLRPLSYVLPLTYGADLLRTAITRSGAMSAGLNFLLLTVFAVGLFLVSTRLVQSRWIQ